MNSTQSRSHTFPWLLVLVPSEISDELIAVSMDYNCLGSEEVRSETSRTAVKLYFENNDAARTCSRSLQKLMPHASVLEKGSVHFEDWESFLHGGFEPMEIEPLFVIPAENPPPVAGHLIPLKIIPGRGFGTGSHPTTRLCLKSLVKYMQPDVRVLDVGTGSGILSVAAALLKASAVDAVETDPDSLINARENAMENGVASSITFHHGSIEQVKGRTYDIVCVNIIQHIISKLLATGLGDLVKPGGILLLSGIFEEEVELFTASLKAFGFSILGQQSQEEWWGFELQKVQ